MNVLRVNDIYDPTSSINLRVHCSESERCVKPLWRLRRVTSWGYSRRREKEIKRRDNCIIAYVDSWEITLYIITQVCRMLSHMRPASSKYPRMVTWEGTNYRVPCHSPPWESSFVGRRAICFNLWTELITNTPSSNGTLGVLLSVRNAATRGGLGSSGLAGWRYFGQDSSCQATWRQTSDRQSTAVSPVRPLANRYLTVPFCPRSRFIIIYCDTVTLITQFISLETLLFLRLASACRREALRVLRPQTAQSRSRSSIRSRVTLPAM